MAIPWHLSIKTARSSKIFINGNISLSHGIFYVHQHWRDLLTFDSRKLIIFFQSRMRCFVNNINNKHKLNSFFRAFIYYFFYTTISFSTTFFCGFSYILYLMNTKITDESTHTYTTEQLTGLQTSNISMHTQNEHFGCQFSEM